MRAVIELYLQKPFWLKQENIGLQTLLVLLEGYYKWCGEYHDCPIVYDKLKPLLEFLEGNYFLDEKVVEIILNESYDNEEYAEEVLGFFEKCLDNLNYQFTLNLFESGIYANFSKIEPNYYYEEVKKIWGKRDEEVRYPWE